MEGEHIHWYVTSRCNLDCAYCFKPSINSLESSETLETIASILADNVQRVTIGGGEPGLVNLEGALRILNSGNVYVSYHTNGLELNVDKLKGLVDDIALPIDSVAPNIQEALRGKEFLPVMFGISDIANEIRENNITSQHA